MNLNKTCKFTHKMQLNKIILTESPKQYLHLVWTYQGTCHGPYTVQTWADQPWTKIGRHKWIQSSAAVYSKTWCDVPCWHPPTSPDREHTQQLYKDAVSSDKRKLISHFISDSSLRQ